MSPRPQVTPVAFFEPQTQRAPALRVLSTPDVLPTHYDALLPVSIFDFQ
jgi:hypothetical protein